MGSRSQWGAWRGLLEGSWRGPFSQSDFTEALVVFSARRKGCRLTKRGLVLDEPPFIYLLPDHSSNPLNSVDWSSSNGGTVRLLLLSISQGASQYCLLFRLWAIFECSTMLILLHVSSTRLSVSRLRQCLVEVCSADLLSQKLHSAALPSEPSCDEDRTRRAGVATKLYSTLYMAAGLHVQSQGLQFSSHHCK